MAKRLLTAGILTIFGLGLLFLRELWPPSFRILACLVMLMAVWEMSSTFRADLTPALRALLMLTAAATLPVSFFLEGSGMILLFAVVLSSFLLMMVTTLFDRNVTLKGMGLYALMLFYPIVLISLFYDLSDQPDGLFLLVITIAGSCLSDTFAFFVGSALKGPKLCPEISPKKTISGALGGVLGGVTGVMASWLVFEGALGIPVSYEWYILLIAGLIGSVFTELGDLVESSLKRRAGVKDFGNLLPGHGGVMDRLDSIMFHGFFVYLFFVVIL